MIKQVASFSVYGRDLLKTPLQKEPLKCLHLAFPLTHRHPPSARGRYQPCRPSHAGLVATGRIDAPNARSRRCLSIRSRISASPQPTIAGTRLHNDLTDGKDRRPAVSTTSRRCGNKGVLLAGGTPFFWSRAGHWRLWTSQACRTSEYGMPQARPLHPLACFRQDDGILPRRKQETRGRCRPSSNACPQP